MERKQVIESIILTDQIEQECMQRAYQKYGEPLPHKAAERLSREISLIRGTDYPRLLLKARKIVLTGKELGKETSFRGCLGSSFLAYLLEITGNNPIPVGILNSLPCEFFYGYNGEKKPDIVLYVDREVKSLFADEKDIHLYCEDDIIALPMEEEKEVKKREKAIYQYFSHSKEDEVKVFGLLHGTGTWEENGEENLSNGWKKENLIAYREDVMHGLRGFGVPRRVAFDMAEKTRRGKMKPEDAIILLSMGVPDDYVTSMMKIRYLFPKAHGIECVTHKCS